MDELIKSLGPWPMIQGLVIGMIVAAAGIWAIRRGIQDSRKNRIDSESLEGIRAKWAAYQQLEHIENNSFEIAALLEKMIEGQARLHEVLNRIADTKWNRHQ
jgi:hypothetical protein